jgi:hypothetical protein
MTMQQSILALAAALDELDRSFDHLAWAVAQGQPTRSGLPPDVAGNADERSPAGALDDLVQELRGWVAEAQNCIDAPLARLAPDATPAYRALVGCQRFAVLLAERFNHHLAAPDALATLGLLSRHDDEGWAAWAFGVRDAIERCRGPLHELNAALLQCWQELAERSEMPNLTVSARRSPGEWPEKPSPELMQSDPGVPGS